MKEIYPDWDITYVLVPTESTVSRQPVGIEETTKGAEARLEQVKKLRPDAFIVSIENGLVEGFDLAVVKVCRIGRVGTALSAGIRIPDSLFPTEGMTVGESVAKRCQSDPGDPHDELTIGYRKRADLLADAIVIAYSATQTGL